MPLVKEQLKQKTRGHAPLSEQLKQTILNHISTIMIKFLLALITNALVGGLVSAAMGISPVIGAIGFNVMAAVAPALPGGALLAGLYAELWTGETVKAFRNSVASLGWLERIRSYDQSVASNNTINFTELGGDPTVLVNNTTYPIGVEALADANKAITLDKYQTKATPVTDDEVRGLAYDKKSTVIERHKETVNEKKFARALHALAPNTNTAFTPVVGTSGEAVEGRKRLTVKDVLAMKAKFDKQRVPADGRVLVLCPDHVNDLLAQDTTFAQRYHDAQDGRIGRLYGFEVFEFVDAPRYNSTSLAKVGFDAEATSTDALASVAFYAPRMMKATGETTAYIDEPDTQQQTWRYNVRHYFICLPLKNEGIGAIVSAKA